MTDFIYWLGEMCVEAFKFIPQIHSSPNVLFIIAGFIGIIGWIYMLIKYNKSGEME